MHLAHHIVIPIYVLMDKKLGDSVKLLYGIIASSCYGNGSCCETNANFSDFTKIFKKRPITIKKWLYQLVEQRYIIVKTIRCIETNKIIKHEIYIISKN